jgi:hypothetical protein
MSGEGIVWYCILVLGLFFLFSQGIIVFLVGVLISGAISEIYTIQLKELKK